MRKFVVRLARLIWGLLLYALGIAITLQAQIGYAPWDVFHAGLSDTLGISIGTASIGTGILVVVTVLLLKEKIGLGSLLNMILVGVFLDLILALGFLPTAGNLFLGIAMMIAGLIVISLATYYYISSAFGAGPRDSLMVAVAKKAKLPVGLCRGAIELTALFCGWLLGGMVGLGTVLFAFLAGFFVEVAFKLLNFEVTKIEHETLWDTYQILQSAGKTKSHPKGW